MLIAPRNAAPGSMLTRGERMSPTTRALAARTTAFSA
jgi:hypothetical protein